ncbi:hypothetical protein SAMN05216238_1053 [Lentibacillus persicus]|uniref:LTD domain-containing protein n=1 Tax=Lentibacillus persicus TaxID=640948 RepID=A0A1I1VTH9_9BACI|nr:endonuclease [Lentibacillus persicus]SFD86155.1 hypothetical protein SAMN05216238_1053 [Lentibacillus persicus]
MKLKKYQRSSSIFLTIIMVVSLLTPASGGIAKAADGTISVADAIENNSGEASVEGYIVGTFQNGPKVVTDPAAYSGTNLALADDPNETDPANVLPVQLPSGDVRDNLNLAEHPELAGEKVILTGNLDAYFGQPGLKDTFDYQMAAEAPAAESLIMSEYVEGSGYNKALEFYNGTGEAIDLTEYSVELYSNGNSEANATLDLSGTLEEGQAYVVYNGQAADALIEKGDLENNSVTNFNGDDAIVLKESDTVIDSFGQVGVQDAWGENVTLIRKPSVTSGDTTTDDAFDPADEWTDHPQNTFENLGAHDLGDSPPPEDEPDVLTIAEARAQGTGDVTVEGTVTAELNNTIHIQDDTAALAIYPKSALDVQRGDRITVSGSLSEYNGLLQLQNPTLTEAPVQGEGTDPIELTGAELNEENESKLARVDNVTLETANDGGNWINYTATDGTAEFLVRDENAALGLTEGATYDSITGIVQEFNGDYQILPRDTADIVADDSVVQPVTATPEAGTIPSGTAVELSTTTEGAAIYCTTNGDDPLENGTLYQEPITVNDDVTIRAAATHDDRDPSPVQTFDYSVYDAEEGVQIHDIQGDGHASPMVGQHVENVEGIVTYIYDLNGGNYLHIQTPDDQTDDNPATSEGLVVYTGNEKADVSIGDLVSVNGTADEYHIDGYSDASETDLPVTQINARGDQGGAVDVLEKDAGLPEPVEITQENLPDEIASDEGFDEFDREQYAIDFWESLEGMRVQTGDLKAVAPQEHGDLITTLDEMSTDTINGGLLHTEDDKNPGRIQFKLHDNYEARDFKVATGDTFDGPMTGVVNYGYQNYKIYADLADMENAHSAGPAEPETTTIKKRDDELTVASYNLENFSNNASSGETPDAKAEKLARAFAHDMESPDIVGVTEVQDNNGQDAGPDDADASESYERLIDEIEEAGGVSYDYANINPEYNEDGGAPDANIRVGFLYNPDRVSLADDMPKGDATTAIGYENGKLTHNPGRIDPTNEAFDDSRKPLAAQFEFNGEEVVVVANHWNSKSGDTPLFGSTQPPELGSEDQRMAIANVVNGFVDDILADNSEANVVLLGDFNDFQFSNPMEMLEGDVLTNLIDDVPEAERYTYTYQGNSQVLDHILVSSNLADASEVDVLHINADFTDMHGRASDHDPVLAAIDLAADEPEPNVPEKSFTLKDFTTNDLVVTSPSVAISLAASSEIAGDLTLTGDYAKLTGEGLAATSIEINPENEGAIVDFAGYEIEEVEVNGENLSEIRGAEGIQEIDYKNGADPETITFTDSNGESLGTPTFPIVNSAPVLEQPIDDVTMAAGSETVIELTDHFSDPDGDALSFTSTHGTIDGSTFTFSPDEGTHDVTVTADDGEATVSAEFTVTAEAQEGDPYYDDAYGKEGDALKDSLHEIISDHDQLSYDEVWSALRETDEDPDNPENVRLFYSGESRSKDKNGGMVGDWNREHVWAKSHGDFGTRTGPGTDIHHLRPTDVQVNSSRGNLDFDNGGEADVTNCDECKRDGDSWEPPNDVKGDVARMLFYMAVRYEGNNYVDLELNEQTGNGSAPYHGKLSVLLDWHEQDPVDTYEMNRNDAIHDEQGNRNPFIDHPQWAEAIWDRGT